MKENTVTQTIHVRLMVGQEITFKGDIYMKHVQAENGGHVGVEIRNRSGLDFPLAFFPSHSLVGAWGEIA